MCTLKELELTKYEESIEAVEILNNFRDEKENIKSTTSDPSSFMDTINKQYVWRGLTHISDQLYSFFLILCEKCLKNRIIDNIYKEGVKFISVLSRRLSE